jgi:hypothetical protein
LMNVLEDAPNHSWFTRPRYLRAATVLSGNALDLPRLASAVLTGSAYLISFVYKRISEHVAMGL